MVAPGAQLAASEVQPGPGLAGMACQLRVEECLPEILGKQLCPLHTRQRNTHSEAGLAYPLCAWQAN